MHGLTPGHYLVQAALDSIWLSESIRMDVTDHDPTDLHLDIDEPGGPVALELKNQKGEPAVGQACIINRPPGPLTDLLWPRTFRSDGAGMVYIPALEIRKTKVRIGQMIAEISPPPVTCDGPTHLSISIKPQY
jgi:hypothetical protein